MPNDNPGLREEVEQLVNYYGILHKGNRSAILTQEGTTVDKKLPSERLVDDVISLIRLERDQAVREVVIEMVHLSDQIELDDAVPSTEEWKAFKHFRNTMRDRYGITADMVRYRAQSQRLEGK